MTRCDLCFRKNILAAVLKMYCKRQERKKKKEEGRKGRREGRKERRMGGRKEKVRWKGSQ